MSRSRRATRVRATALLGVGTLLVGGGLAGLAPGGATASSHREAPGILDDPQYDNTDVYAFAQANGKVNLIANWYPNQEPAGGPNFYPWATDAKHKINIDNDDDAKPDIVYVWKFRNARTPGPNDSFTGNGTFLYNNGPVTSLKDKNLLFRQTYDLKRIKVRKGPNKVRTLLNNAPVAPSHAGDASMPNYNALRNAAVKTYNSTRRSFAGQAEDPFFLDLRVFDVLYGGDCRTESGDDTLNGFNVNSLALQVPRRDLTAKGQDVVGIWSTTDRKNSRGQYKQVSRLGNPLVNEVVIPYRVKDTFNSLKPKSDAAALPFVRNSELAATLNAVCGTDAPVRKRADLVQVFLKGVPGINNPKGKGKPSEMLRLNTRWQAGQSGNSRLGVLEGDMNGFPNGRRLHDDVVDIALQVVGGELVGKPNDLGDGVNANDTAFGENFPFLALPHSGSITKSAPPAETGSALLTGGGSNNGTGGFPSGEVSLISLGALAILAGAVLGRRTRRTAPVTA